MQQSFRAGLALSGLLILGLAVTVPAFPAAPSPYWDNSSDNGQTYYNPGVSTPPPQQQPQPGYYGQQPSYGSPQGYGAYPQQGYGTYTPPQGGGYQQGYGQQQALRGYVSTAPAGTTVSVTNTTYLSSATARIGDPITVTLAYDLASGGQVILPSGTQVMGEVASSIPAGRAANHGQLQLRFNRANLPDGRSIPLSARLVTQDGSGIIRGGTTAQRWGSAAKNTLGGAAIGAAGGTALGAITSGGRRWNEGLLWGSILGAGAGLARTTVQRGEEAQLQPGTQIQIMLDQPLNLTGATMGGGGYASPGYPY